MQGSNNYNTLSLYAMEKELMKARKRRDELINSFDEMVEELAQYTSYEEALTIALENISKEDIIS
ncbi:MAG: hypothetical protein IKL53_04690 [Lachnospiraceae bacterium]|nr:hypothetical protein [Lachnospiraceae bacterium]